jgi:hypothetical protein
MAAVVGETRERLPRRRRSSLAVEAFVAAARDHVGAPSQQASSRRK